MPTPPEHEIATERVVHDDPVAVETVETSVAPPAPVPPPPGTVAGPYVESERVIVEDPDGTRVVTRDVRPPLPPEEDPRRWNWLTPTLIAICLLALGIVLAAIVLQDDDKKSSTNGTTTVAQSTTPAAPANSPVQVPSLVGQNRSAAEAALDRAGFAVVVATVPGPAPAGQVLAQSPGAGETATTGDTVRINVSDGQQTASTGTATTPTPAPSTSTPAATTPATSTPNSSNSSSTEPTQTQQTTTPPTDAQPTQASQPPAPAPTPVAVPALSGDVKSSVQRLSNAGLLASLQYVPSDEPLGTVTAQSPSEGASSKTGAHVTLSVSSGPGDKEQHTVPDAAGQTIPQAVETMNAAGLRLILVKKTVTDREQAGKVVEQTPAPGAKAPKNAQILVYMGAFKG